MAIEVNLEESHVKQLIEKIMDYDNSSDYDIDQLCLITTFLLEERNKLRQIALDWLKGEEKHWSCFDKDCPDYDDLVKKTRALEN